MHISLPFHKSCKGGDAVPNEMIGLAKNVQINLRHLWLQAHNLDLQRKEEQSGLQSAMITTKTPCHNISNGKIQQNGFSLKLT